MNTGSRHCTTESREGMLVNMNGDLLVLVRVVDAGKHAKFTRNPVLFLTAKVIGKSAKVQ